MIGTNNGGTHAITFGSITALTTALMTSFFKLTYRFIFNQAYQIEIRNVSNV
jgi:hypothetical protein